MRQENLDGLCECECEVSENSVHALQSEEIVQLLHEYQIEAAIIPLTTLVTKRAVVETENAELCFDISTYGSHTDYEIEYEYKQPHDGLSVFQKLLRMFLSDLSNGKSPYQDPPFVSAKTPFAEEMPYVSAKAFLLFSYLLQLPP